MNPDPEFELLLRGAPARFQAAARYVWEWIPGAVREDLRRGWLPRKPLLMVVPDLAAEAGRPFLGCYQPETGAMFFDRRAVERLEDWVLVAVICHEFAHAWRAVRGLGRGASESADEEATRLTAAGWGFADPEHLPPPPDNPKEAGLEGDPAMVARA